MLCHHGLFWDFHPRAIGPAMKRRLRSLFDADISLAGLPPAARRPPRGRQQRADLRGARPGAGRAASPSTRAARSASSAARPRGSPFAELRERCAAAFGQEPVRLGRAGPSSSTASAIVSGGGARATSAEAIALGLDAFLTGEPAEHVMADARENGVHFIAGGHYATERFGVRRLGELVAERFGVEHRFVDMPNPI